MSAGVLIAGLLTPAECGRLGAYADERLKAPLVSIEEREPGQVSVLRNTAADAIHPRAKPGGDLLALRLPLDALGLTFVREALRSCAAPMGVDIDPAVTDLWREPEAVMNIYRAGQHLEEHCDTVWGSHPPAVVRKLSMTIRVRGPQTLSFANSNDAALGIGDAYVFASWRQHFVQVSPEPRLSLNVGCYGAMWR